MNEDGTQAQDKDQIRPLPSEKASVTHHRMDLNGELIEYDATVGFLTLKNDKDESTAAIFYTAYTKRGIQDLKNRPVTFCFNGGPGSCSVWLHLGAFGPKRIEMVDADYPRPNLSSLIDNDCTLLDLTDLVFIDPVGTGFSRSGGVGKDEDFFGLESDADSLTQFILRYITINKRWVSPKFIAGESYGTTRTGAIANRLQEKGIALNGLLLVSLAVNFQTFIFDIGNDLPYLTFLPTYTAIAWFHSRLQDLQSRNLDELLKEVRQWSYDVYGPALMRGMSLSNDNRREVAEQLAAYTGLEVDEILDLNLRITDMRFSKSVLKQHGVTVGRMDGRYRGLDFDLDHRRTQRDPSMDAPMTPYTGLINDYLRNSLKFESDKDYKIFNMTANEKWQWSRERRLGYPDTSDELRKAMITNPYLKVLFANGLYDLATPFFAAEYTADHLALSPALKDNLRLTYYPAGHMMYFNRESHIALKSDIAEIITDAIERDQS